MRVCLSARLRRSPAIDSIFSRVCWVEPT